MSKYRFNIPRRSIKKHLKSLGHNVKEIGYFSLSGCIIYKCKNCNYYINCYNDRYEMSEGEEYKANITAQVTQVTCKNFFNLINCDLAQIKNIIE